MPALATLLRESSGYATLSAHGAGSRISLPALEQTTVSEYYALELEALDGGTIEAPAFSAFTGGLEVFAADANTLIDLSGFQGLLQNSSLGSSRVEVRAGATVLVPNVTGYDNVRLVIQDDGQIATSQLTRFLNEELVLSGTELLLPNLTNFANGDIYLQNGASLALPGLTRLDRNVPGDLTLQAEGPGGLLELPDVSR